MLSMKRISTFKNYLLLFLVVSTNTYANSLAESDQRLNEFLTNRIMGQPEVVEKVKEILLQDEALKSREVPELLYLMGGPGTGKDTTAQAMIDAAHGVKGAYKEHMFTIEPLLSDADLWKILGSNTGYLGSDQFPPFLEFLINHSGGRYLLHIEKDMMGKSIMSVVENPNWAGENLEGYSTPDKALVFLNEFHDWSKGVKNSLIKKFLETGTVPINNPNGGLKELHVPVTIIMASNEGIGLVSSREINGQRFGRPLSYEDSTKLWEVNHTNMIKLKEELQKTGGAINSAAGVDGKGNSEELINRIPADRLMLLRPLSPESVQKIAVIKLTELRQKIIESSGDYKNITLTWDNSLPKFIQNYHYLAEDNARPIGAKVKSLIQTTFFQAIISGQLEAGSSDTVSLSIVKAEDETYKLHFDITDKSGKKTKSFALPIKETQKDAIVKPISDERIEELLGMNTRMKSKVFGAEKVIDQVSESLLLSDEGRVAIRTIDDAKSPARAFMFLGPSSTGKTELAKVIAEEVLGDRNDLVTIDFSQVTSIDDIKDRILGRRDGSGNPIPSEFMKEYDRRSGKVVVVFDEIANANPAHLKALYDILREPIVSTFSDKKERIMSNVVIIMTGNAGEEWYQDIPSHAPEQMQRVARDQVYKRMTADGTKSREILEKYFSEALINRVGERNIFFFPSLSNKASMELFNLKMSQMLKDLLPKDSKRGWIVKFENENEYKAIATILEDEAFILKEQGASIDRFIKQTLGESLRALLLRSHIPSGAELVLRLSQKELAEGKILLKIIQKDAPQAKPIELPLKRKARSGSLKRSGTDIVLTAYHEAGHSIARQVLFGDVSVPFKISIIPGVEQVGGKWVIYEGIAVNLPTRQVQITREVLKREIAVLSAGYVGQMLVTVGEKIDAGLSNDIQRANDYALRGILELGLSDKWGKITIPRGAAFSALTEAQKELLWSEVKILLNEAEELARASLTANFNALQVLAVALAERGELGIEDLQNFYRVANLKKEKELGAFLTSNLTRSKSLTFENIVTRDLELIDGIRLPRKLANINQLLFMRKAAELAKVTNFSIVPNFKADQEIKKSCVQLSLEFF